MIVVDQQDNVATALRSLEQGESIELEVAGGVQSIRVLRPIPFGHKLALTDIEAGQPVVKYGEVIGLATAKITKGQHVHVHNVEGLKAREDRA